MQDLYCTYTVKMKQLMAANTFLLYFVLNKILLHIYDKASYAMLSTFVKIKVLLEMKYYTWLINKETLLWNSSWK